jgi:hypothetical protein
MDESMIWYLSLEPRIVEILLKSSGAIHSNAALLRPFEFSETPVQLFCFPMIERELEVFHNT